ncbi:MAG: Coenzyme F420 hydrogenase/dehydrogenase, beta subunit C-terminal domain [Emcibacter sp.]|nr:Coenzyme F420 hydrogenase/dehydrogenase, beta subunit C-terminal domain [Emcibacter sp.]
MDERSKQVIERYRSLLDDNANAQEWAFSWRTELNRGGFQAVDLLMEEVVKPGKCIGCAACVTICPVDVFDYKNENPINARPDACVQCVLCAEVCPVLRPADKDLPALLDYQEPIKDEGYGPYAYGIYSRSTDSEILKHCQDGGMVSSLILHGMETGTIEGAILGDVMEDNRQIGRHKLALTREDVLNCAASRYTYSPNTLAFQEAIEQKVGPVAMVGVPCQVDGLRLQQNSSIRQEMSKWYKNNVSLVFGLFCSESFTHESITKLGEILEIDPKTIKNINIKGKVIIRLDNGETREVSLKKYRDFARPACLYCLDYGAESADIGAGGIGLDGWTYTLIRTKRGHKAFQEAVKAGKLEVRPLSDDPRGEFLMNMLSKNKKENRPLPAKMPTHAEREALGSLCPKTFYTTGPGAPTPKNEKTEQ